MDYTLYECFYLYMIEAEEKQVMLDELSAKFQEEKRSADEQICTLSVKLTIAQEEIDVQNVSKLSVKKCYYIVFLCRLPY